MTAAPPAAETWMPNGFPPPSFVVETERSTRFAGTTFASHRGRWLAAAAILGALLLITGILLIARDDPETDVATSASTTTTAFGDTTPTFPASTALDPTATIPDANTVPGGGAGVPVDPGVGTVPSNGGGAAGAGAPASAPTGGSGPSAAQGAIVAEPSTVNVPTIDATDPARARQGTKLTLRNTGGTSVNFRTVSGYGGLSASPSTGNIPAGGSLPVDILLDGTNAAEGNPFSAQIRFAESPQIGTTVTVNAIVRRPPSLAGAGNPTPLNCPTQPRNDCSNQVLRTPGKSACEAEWRIKVAASDPAGLKPVTAQITTGATTKTVTLSPESPDRTDSPFWISAPEPAVKGSSTTPVTTTFTVTATDNLGASTTGATQTIACP